MTEDDDTIDVEAVPGEQTTKETREREPGKSVLPLARVQKIIKADKDVPMVARDAAFLISMATEEFIKRLAQASQKVSEREKRSTVQQRDVASVTRRAEEFFFLDEIISGPQPATAKRKPKALQAEQPEEPTLLDRFMKKTEVAMDEDGLMYAT
ncbi:histone-like transcription factor (CBF/NF-Y) and archaeal histone-domain-containing protein [Pisolithus marmoratus]|nr:histone-like transcription factor (CBF/NF-Y) and archaeal histone-domain-containing protein [Pisolithus marmoratus]